MKFVWDCKNPKCMETNRSEVDAIFIGDDGSMLIDLGPCIKCGNPHRKLTIWNQRVDVKHVGASSF